jgi:cellulose synthase/poly-beta-1,6-N-acetylglucosamine synthase-like glycosyltransferase
MISLLEALFAIPALLLLALAVFFALEVVGALLPARRAPSGPARNIAVVIPAHNEAQTITPTLASIKAQLKPGDRLIVVADNCDDGTAEIAMRAGAACLIRNDPSRRGKGYALQFALDKLRDEPPEIVFFIDADCQLGEGALQRVAGAAAASGRPAQGLYLMQAGEDAPAPRMVAEFAWTLMNRVRMSGLSTLFDVCRLTGAGMALPWPIAAELDLASGEIVEDLALTVKLVSADAAPLFCPDALITSEFPSLEEAAITQRARWEHGALRLAWKRAPALLGDAVSVGDIRRGALAFDMLIPPLTVFLAALAAALAAGLFLLAIGADLPFRLAASAFGLYGLSVGAAWLGFGLEDLPPEKIGAVFGYLVEKVKVYGKKARASTAAWTRTQRDDAKEPNDD